MQVLRLLFRSLQFLSWLGCVGTHNSGFHVQPCSTVCLHFSTRRCSPMGPESAPVSSARWAIGCLSKGYDAAVSLSTIIYSWNFPSTNIYQSSAQPLLESSDFWASGAS